LLDKRIWLYNEISEVILVLVKSDDVIKAIERISYHYHLNITNRVLRPLILQLYIDERTWKQIETFTERLEDYRYCGYKLDDLYKQLAACARFIEIARNGIYSIKNKVKADVKAPDRIYREITVNNLPNNLQILSDLLKALYALLIEFDQKNSGKNHPVYTQVQELSGIHHLLAGS
jgi:hypothetical protein